MELMSGVPETKGDFYKSKTTDTDADDGKDSLKSMPLIFAVVNNNSETFRE